MQLSCFVGLSPTGVSEVSKAGHGSLISMHVLIMISCPNSEKCPSWGLHNGGVLCKMGGRASSTRGMAQIGEPILMISARSLSVTHPILPWFGCLLVLSTASPMKQSY